MVAKHERKGRDPGGHARTAGLGRSTASPLAKFRFTPQQRGRPVVTDAASRAALKGSADCPSQVAAARIEQYSGIRVSLNNQLFPSLHLAFFSLVHLATTQAFIVTCPALSPQGLSDPTHTRSVAEAKDNQRDGRSSLVHFDRTLTDMLRKSVLRFRAEG